MADQKQSPHKASALQYIRTIYLSLGAVIGLICFIMGASGAVKLALNHWFPSDDFYYSAPYGQSICEMGIPDVKGVNQKLSPEEVKTCEKRTEESQNRQNTSNFNREISQSVALTLVGFPIWLLHFWLMQEDWKRRKEF